MVLKWLVYLLRLMSTSKAVIGFSARVINLSNIIFSSIITWVQLVSNRACVSIKTISILFEVPLCEG